MSSILSVRVNPEEKALLEAAAAEELTTLSEFLRRMSVRAAEAQQRNRTEALPALLLGQLAVDRRFQGQGHAVDLLQEALQRALFASKTIGAMAVITHPLDDSVRGFYTKQGFQDLPFDSRRAMIVRMQDLQLYFGPSAGRVAP